MDNTSGQKSDSNKNNSIKKRKSDKVKDRDKNSKKQSDDKTKNKTESRGSVKKCEFRYDKEIGLPTEVFATSFYPKRKTHSPKPRTISSSSPSMDTELEEIEEYYSNEVSNDSREVTSSSMQSLQNYSRPIRTPDALKPEEDSVFIPEENGDENNTSDNRDSND